MAERDCVITFPNLTNAMKFEKKMKEMDMNIKIIPVPRSISSSCGICGKFDCAKKADIEELCHKNHIRFDGVYSVYPMTFESLDNGY
ncbi:MAG: DUF3343 domain-containing protein [Eubacteriales bacterium]|nr:DUF3343 domain-containing protein [Eubacteriales bacterium]